MGHRAGLTEQHGLAAFLAQPIGERGAKKPPLAVDLPAWQGLPDHQAHDGVLGHSEESGHHVDPRHDERFWPLVERVLPDYRQCAVCWPKRAGRIRGFQLDNTILLRTSMSTEAKVSIAGVVLTISTR
jgi:hypothetical protein